jgi:hypothetical protein
VQKRKQKVVIRQERFFIPAKNGTIQMMKKAGIPVNRKNFLMVEYLGSVPAEIDPEQEAEMPSFTTASGIPLCDRCNRSTRSRLQLLCKGCREKTCLLLSDSDKKFLKAVGVKR